MLLAGRKHCSTQLRFFQVTPAFPPHAGPKFAQALPVFRRVIAARWVALNREAKRSVKSSFARNPARKKVEVRTRQRHIITCRI